MPENQNDELRALFDSEADAPNRIDAARVIGRSRARRVPKQIAAGAVGALAIAGIVVVGVNTSQFTQPTPATVAEDAPAGGADESAMQSGAADSDLGTMSYDLSKRAPADRINLCTGTVAELAPSFYGLELEMVVPDAAAVGTAPIDATARLTNASDSRVTGYTAAVPAVTLSQDGIVKWHSNGMMIMSVVEVDLAPGESIEYPASFTPVECGVEDDLADGFRADLPAVPAGEYEVSAVIDFNPDGSMPQQEMPEIDLVSGPATTVTLQ